MIYENTLQVKVSSSQRAQANVKQQRSIEIPKCLVIQHEIQRALTTKRRRLGTNAVPHRFISRIPEFLLEFTWNFNPSYASHAHPEHRLFKSRNRLPAADDENKRFIRLSRALNLLRLVPRGVTDPINHGAFPFDALGAVANL